MTRNLLIFVLSLTMVTIILIGVIIGIFIFWFLKPIEEETSPSWSPDGQYLVYECYIDGPTSDIAEDNGVRFDDEAADICKIEVSGGNPIRLTTDMGADRYPVWSPKGRQIAYMRRDGIYIVDVNGGNKRQLIQLPGRQNAFTEVGNLNWSPDGDHLLFSACLDEKLNRDLYLLDVNNNSYVNITPENDEHAFSPRWARDGEIIVYLSTPVSLFADSCVPDTSASRQIMAINADGTGKRVVYDLAGSERIFPEISVSSNGHIAFTTNLDIRSLSSEGNDDSPHLYLMGLEATEPIQIVPASGPVSWAPNGRWLTFGRSLKQLDAETNEIRDLPPLEPGVFMDGLIVWSPDSRRFGITASQNPTGFYQEKHIYIFDLQNDTVRPLIQK